MTDRHSISPYPIRMPSDLRERLEQAAKQGSRSLHAEIIARLESTFTPAESAVERAARLDQIREKAMPGMVEILADLQAKVAQEIEQRAREIASLRLEQRDLAVESLQHKIPTRVTETDKLRPASKRITRTRKKSPTQD
jgi:Arc-like DNA binding domain